VRAEFMAAPLGEFLPAHPGYCGERVWVLMMLEPWLAGLGHHDRHDG
jgi:asparagine synthase (glutamine-hydrolysing)